MRSRRVRVLLVTAALLLVLAGVIRFSSGSGETAHMSFPADVGMTSDMTAAQSAFSTEQLAALGYMDAGGGSPAGEDEIKPLTEGAPGNSSQRYLIKDATLTVNVEDALIAADRVTESVTRLKGYAADRNESGDSFGMRQVWLKVHVPADQLDAALGKIALLGSVVQKNITARDVTGEYIDNEARIRNLNRAEERLLEHLSRTASLSDIVEAERELTRVREQIERIEGRMRYLDQHIAFSTIHLTIQEYPRVGHSTRAFSTGRIATQAIRSLVGGLQLVWTASIWAGVWSVCWVPVLFIVWFLRRRFRSA